MTTIDQLPQAFSASKLCVPLEIGLDSGWLTWKFPEYMGSVVGRKVAAEGLLDRFLQIKTAKDACEFARTFGTLGICAHGKPICHADLPGGGLLYDPNLGEQGGVPSVSPPCAQTFYCPPTQLPDGRFGERVEWWLKLAEAMRACVEISISQQKARRPRSEDLATVYRTLLQDINPLPTTEALFPEKELAEEAGVYANDGPVLPNVEGTRADGLRSRAWILVLELLNKWLIACPLRLYFTYTDSSPVDFSMSFVAGDQRGCFPALIFELIARIRASKGKWMVNCAHCKVLVSPRREPREDGRVFCQACRAAGWPVRYATRAYYERNRRQILARRKKNRKKKQ